MRIFRLRKMPLYLLVLAHLQLAWGSATALADTLGANWVGAWSAAPSGASGHVLVDGTVRMTLTPHLSGQRARLHLTNRFGKMPLSIKHVTIAQDAGGGAIAPSSLRHVTFAGRQEVIIPAAAELLSDAVEIPVSQWTKLSVSIAIQGMAWGPTEHHFAQEYNYISPSGAGDHAADPTGAAFYPVPGDVPSGWYFLRGLQVDAPQGASAVVTLGDSLTDGEQRTAGLLPIWEGTGKDYRYPDFLQRRLTAAGKPIAVLNAGISGNRVLADSLLFNAGPSALSRLEADVIRQPRVRTVIIWEGINDLGQNPFLNPQQLIDGYANLISRLKAANKRVLIGTITPAKGFLIPTYGNLFFEAKRMTVNQWIRTQTLADGIVDFDAAVRDPLDKSRLRSGYHGGDHLHFSPAGNAALAAAVPIDKL